MIIYLYQILIHCSFINKYKLYLTIWIKKKFLIIKCKIFSDFNTLLANTCLLFSHNKKSILITYDPQIIPIASSVIRLQREDR